MKLIETGFEDLFVIETNVFPDDRGYFFEAFNASKLRDLGLEINVVQTNISKSCKGVVRGLHFQNPPHAQGKLIRVLNGAVLDVAVDLRKNSKTFGKYYAVELSNENKLALWIPEGFAHGFKTLEDDTLFYYDCTDVYNRESEGSIIWNDPDIGIDWNIENPIISEKDAKAPLFRDFETQF
ncbi:MAG: dTDP-4-dehydrorhamnose 3,5-epimerase [Flavobacteriales bacterium]|nr:dTDP-4-dehydrorhamnose 3,5-epimerase [Flavobacteriales bacterium]MCB9192038.1 dTDP-4-dehydrorhamnose 3,5-epimerase [Flavobacteriales bacterium]